MTTSHWGFCISLRVLRAYSSESRFVHDRLPGPWSEYQPNSNWALPFRVSGHFKRIPSRVPVCNLDLEDASAISAFSGFKHPRDAGFRECPILIHANLI